MKLVKVVLLLLAIGISVGLMDFKDGLAAEQGQCPRMPKVSWWSNTSHDKLIKYVNRTYGGDWSLYITVWDKHLNKVMKAFELGKGVALLKSKVDFERGEIQRMGAVKGDKIVLAYEDLGLYIPKLVQRTAVTRCLANEAASRLKTPQSQAAIDGRTAKQSQCPQVPKVSWWNNTSHEELIKHVNRRLVGNWPLYHATWDNHLSRLIKAFEEGRGVKISKSKVDLNSGEIQRDGAIKGNKIELAHEDLGLYIPKVVQRMAIHRCLENEVALHSKRP